MAQPVTIEAGFAGMARDYSRDALPAGLMWNMRDFIPNDLGAPLRKRGGWVYASSAMTSPPQRLGFTESTTAGLGGLYAIDSATSTSVGPFLWSIDTTTGTATSSAGLSAASAASTVGTSVITNMVYYAGRLMVGVQQQGKALFRYTVSGNSWSTVGNQGCFLAVYKDRLVSAYDPVAPKRIYFSSAGNPTTSDPLGYIDANNEIIGIAALANTILVFSTNAVERIRGSIPPPGSDMVLEKVSDFGCSDFRSIQTWQNKCIYADLNGVYMTDGASTIDLIAQGGMTNYYRPLLANSSSWKLVGGIYRHYYFLTISSASLGTSRGGYIGSGTFVDCLVCNLLTRRWFRLNNFPFQNFIQSFGVHQDFYGASQSLTRVARITDIFNPTAQNGGDDNGHAVEAFLETGMHRGWVRYNRRWVPASGQTHWRRLYTAYDCSATTAVGLDPTLTLSYVTDPSSSSYTALAPVFPTTVGRQRKAVSFGGSGVRGGRIEQEIGFKIEQLGYAADTKFFNLEAEYETIEGSALEQ